LISLSHHIKFGTVQVLPNRRNSTLIKAIQSVLSVYRTGGFSIEAALMDGEFACLRDQLGDHGVVLNETSRDEHVGDVERYI
jgi:hypothetical protein